jgi:hypothetical protein
MVSSPPVRSARRYFPTVRGPAFQPQNGLRDPFVLDDDGERWLYYAAAGEFALGVVPLPEAT